MTPTERRALRVDEYQAMVAHLNAVLEQREKQQGA